MLLPVEVAPLLSHEDSRVRLFALEYLAGAHDPGPFTADDLWVAAERATGDDRQYLFRALGQFPTTPDSTERILEGLRSEKDDVVLHHLAATLRSATGDVVRRALGDPTIAERLFPRDRGHLEDVLFLADKSFDELWKIVETCPVDIQCKYLLMAPTIYRVNRLAEALARFPEQAAGRALDGVLDAHVGSRGRWLQAFSVRLLVALPQPSALVPLLRIAGDEGALMFLHDWTEDALVRLGTREVVAAVAAGIGSSGSAWFGRHAPQVLGRIKRPESELALLRLLSATSDVRRCTELGMALCHVGTTSPGALDRLHALVSSHHFDPMHGSLDEELLTLCAALGLELPEAPAWRDRISAREAALELAGDEYARQLAAEAAAELEASRARREQKG